MHVAAGEESCGMIGPLAEALYHCGAVVGALGQ